MNGVAVVWVDLIGSPIMLQGWRVILAKTKAYPFDFYKDSNSA